MKTGPRELRAEELRKECDPESLGFESTEAIEAEPGRVIAQERAVKALLFGAGMKGLDYNIFVAGPPKSGMSYITRTLIEDLAKDRPVPQDWCYVHNFQEPDRPRAISLPSGWGKRLKKDVQELIGELRNHIPEVFESEDYSQRKEELIKKFNLERTAILAALEEKALKEGFILNVNQVGMVIMPAHEGRPMDEETLNSLTDEEKKALREKSEQLQGEMNLAVRTIRSMEKDLRKKMKDLDRRIALYAVGHLIDDLQEKYQAFPQVLRYFKEMKDDIIRNLDDFKAKPVSPMPFPVPQPEPSMTRYQVNVLIDHTETKGAPVVLETHPTYTNLFGSIEKQVQFGALYTDFTLIRPGSLHRANGGFLIIKALDLLRWYFSWEGLKRSLKTGRIQLEDLGEQLSLISTKFLKPEPIPLQVKVVLIGEPYLYHLLYALDPDFPKMFKVKAELDDEMEREEGPTRDYVRYIARYCREKGLLPVHKTGAARLIEYGAELTGRNFKLSLKLAEINTLLDEAHYWAEQERSPLIRGEHMEKAIEERIFRSNLWEEKVREAIRLGDYRVETDGYRIGQINGLSVLPLGDYQFGRPTRITVNGSLGKEGVIDIERESKLSGNLHTKGVLILSGYLKSTYASDKPLSLSATITFEQSYGLVEGDSASAAELIALLSVLADAPLYQGIAVTGSISQKGEVQPVGGVNEKIEGFFEVCRERGLTGRQGVVIPVGNVKDLMLKPKVVEAVRQGLFHVYPISHVEEGMEILSGKQAGRRKKDGTYPKGSLNYLIEEKLKKLNALSKERVGKGNRSK